MRIDAGIPVNARSDFVAGTRTVLPLLVGVIPFGLIAGITAVKAGMAPAQAIAMSVVVFAGAAQLAAIELIDQSAPVIVIVVTAIVINLRFMMYSASIAPYFRPFDLPSKLLGGYLITDQAYAVSILEFRNTSPEDRSRKWFYFGVALPFWAVWQVSTITGAILGKNIPESLSLEFTVPLMFIALVFPALEDRSTELTALVAGGVSIIAGILPLNLGLITAAIAGMAAGVVFEIYHGTFPNTNSASNDEFPSKEGGDEL